MKVELSLLYGFLIGCLLDFLKILFSKEDISENIDETHTWSGISNLSASLILVSIEAPAEAHSNKKFRCCKSFIGHRRNLVD